MLLKLLFTFSLVTATVNTAAQNGVIFPELARNSQERIVSGWEAEPGQFPYQLLLRMLTRLNGIVSSCGGVLVHNEWALTAAHCLSQRITVVIRAGAVNVTRPQYIFESTEYYQHPLYNNLAGNLVQEHDISILRLNRYIPTTDFVKPVRLESYNNWAMDYNGVVMVATGWGRMWGGNPTLPENMNWVYLHGVTNEFCLQQYPGLNGVHPSTVCTIGYNETSQSICQGDSGGALTRLDLDGEPSLVGIVAFVSLECHTALPSGFVRVAYYHSWIQQVTGINFDWSWGEERQRNQRIPE